jgi:hypothetical protein
MHGRESPRRRGRHRYRGVLVRGRCGHAFTPRLVVVAGPAYVVEGTGQGDVTLELQLNVVAL